MSWNISHIVNIVVLSCVVIMVHTYTCITCRSTVIWSINWTLWFHVKNVVGCVSSGCIKESIRVPTDLHVLEWSTDTPVAHVRNILCASVWGTLCSKTKLFRSAVQVMAQVSLFVGCLTSQQHPSVSQGRICTEFCVLPHWYRICRSNFPSHPVTVYWHRADQSQRWPYNARRLARWPLECQCLSHWYDSSPKKIPAQAGFEPGAFRSRGGCLNH